MACVVSSPAFTAAALNASNLRAARLLQPSLCVLHTRVYHRSASRRSVLCMHTPMLKHASSEFCSAATVFKRTRCLAQTTPCESDGASAAVNPIILCNTKPAARTVLKAHSVYLHCCSAEERPRLVHVVPARKQHCEIVHAEPVLLHSRRSCSVQHPGSPQPVATGVRCMHENSACVAFNATFSIRQRSSATVE